MKVFAIILILAPAAVYGQSGEWVGCPPNSYWWLMAERLERFDQGGVLFTPIRVSGGVPIEELDYYHLADMAGGTEEAGYFWFTGTYYIWPEEIFGEIHYYKYIAFNWPAGIVGIDDLVPPYRNWVSHTYAYICGCYDYSGNNPPPDSAYDADGLGYLHIVYPPPPQGPYWSGYIMSVTHADPCIP